MKIKHILSVLIFHSLTLRLCNWILFHQTCFFFFVFHCTVFKIVFLHEHPLDRHLWMLLSFYIVLCMSTVVNTFQNSASIRLVFLKARTRSVWTSPKEAYNIMNPGKGRVRICLWACVQNTDGERVIKNKKRLLNIQTPYPSLILHSFLAKRPAVHLKSCDASRAPSLLSSHITKTPGLRHLPKSTKNLSETLFFKKEHKVFFFPFVPSPCTPFTLATKPCLMAPGEKRPRLRRLFLTKRA